MEIQELLADAASRCTPPNYSGLARALGVEPSAVSNWRHGRALPDTVSCGKLADLTGLPVSRVVGMIGEARAISRDEKAVWRRVKAAAAIAWLAVALPYDVHASTGANAEPATTGCIMRNVVAFIRSMFGWSHGPAPVLA